MAASKAQILPLFGVYFLLLVSISLPNSIQSRPVNNPFDFIQNLQGSHKGQNVKGLRGLKLYLHKFGYLNKDNNDDKNHAITNVDDNNDDEFDDSLESAIKTYQRRHRLKVTGILDVETVNQMTKPRCGFPDIIMTFNNNNNFGNPHIWPPNVTHLRYRFLTTVEPPVGTQDLKAIVARAFEKWAQVSRFTFEQVAEDIADSFELEIGFHGTQKLASDPHDIGFDGPRGVSAHADLPPRGNLHYDKDEAWSSNPGADQIDLESIALHEIGHLLGLEHSVVPESVMYGVFEYGTKTKRDLHPDDIESILELYGSA
ncbi:Peptidase M10, metallopeptidase [Corchorus capsularis]|uniref:Peptidase M10, metallopeptidase n=1 Tax=Corchorus capsularis TaxID=210143 RepID=A0A1R3HT28_COCAP|nr:Peptidase M10, metallopeptidase [Corchorus capsularis]